ncbi:thiamin biosynthesis lipoprotein ApbE [Agrilactobacillus composti DSM 18527 = JCM 14202]|uniref:FAD:protein FMN transferase n=1 Tax=Agrilactobacillus composti TaxID=398555 RepID=UPI00042DE746|nr:FAD:protein FMN transferase [Agrilactobacillus composti]GAF41302.1 thiamin biosynthesis lipoprotein ApbE [Agrilactobacillus composti DSM 18527 = JCM 14202]
MVTEPEFQQLYAATQQAQKVTGSFFDPFFDGAYNPTGYVKGWAIAQIFKQYLQPLLADPQVMAVGVNGGGDLQLASKDPAQFTWHVGVEQPADLQQLLASYALANGAMATSSTSKRGQHIQRGTDADLTQVTVIAAEITTADVWATALMAAPFADVKALILQHQLSGVLVYHGQRYDFDKGVLANAENL